MWLCVVVAYPFSAPVTQGAGKGLRFSYSRTNGTTSSATNSELVEPDQMSVISRVSRRG